MPDATPLALLALAVALVATPHAAHAHDSPHWPVGGSDRIGVLLVDHGEPPEYNADTYWSFRAFFAHLIEMGVIPRWLGLVDRGTVLADAACFGCGLRASPHLMDAWLKPHDGPAVFQPASDSMPAHYVVPGGQGFGEPDIYEIIGLAAWHEWQIMGGRSPNYDQKLPKKAEVIRRLHETYGTNVPIRVGYHIDPRLGGGTQGVRRALTELINRERVDRLVVAYHGVGFSDIMQTHMIRHEVEGIRDELDASVSITYADPIGVTDAYVAGVVEHVLAELARVPAHRAVAIHLSEHGLPTGMCGEYDCGADTYHEFAAALFARTRTAILHAVDRPGRIEVFQVYGDGGTDDDDADDVVDGPVEALDERADAGFEHVIDVPYAFDADSRDTLIVLRRGYGRPAADWNPNFETHFEHAGMHVRITNSQFGTPQETDALEEVIRAGIRAATEQPSRPSHDH